MQKKVLEYVKEQNMLRAGDHVVVGVSGGADSVALLCVLRELREELGIELQAVHIHHGLRGAEADRDAAFAEDLCAQWGISCRVLREDVKGYAAKKGISEEEAGRELRYRRFAELLGDWENVEHARGEKEGRYWIAVAHHREDQAETILHHLFRGSGLKGLGGMAPMREQIIRPLLVVSKAEILEYLQQNGQSYCQDSTNESCDYTRNRLRNQLIPWISREINAGAVEHIVHVGKRMAQADAYLESEAEKLWAAHGMEQEDRCGIAASVLLESPEILQTYLIRCMLKRQSDSMKNLTARHVEQILTLAGKGTGKQTNLPDERKAWTEYGTLWISGGKEVKMVDNVKLTHFPYEKTQEIPRNRYTKWFDYDKIKGTLSVRTRKTGDFITLADGKHKTIKSYMIDEKIPRYQRDQILLLAEGSHVLWIVGYRISEYYKVTAETMHILQAEADGGEEHGR